MVGLMLIAFGLLERGWLLLAVWLGADFLALGIAHARGFHRILGKRSDGSLPLWSWLLFLPMLLYTNAVWQILRMLSREPPFNQVSDNLSVGRRLLPGEVEGEFANYIDLTAEFSEPLAIRTSAAYLSFPILDGAAPDSTPLNQFLNRLRPGRTFIHCAQGHGRTGLFALAVMLKSGVVKTVGEGTERLKAVRPGIHLAASQRKCIEQFAAALKARSVAKE
jgi:hypothetical protein